MREVSELYYLSNIGSDQIRAMTTRVGEETPEVEIIEMREEIHAESPPAHSIHDVDTDSESTTKAIRREFGDTFPELLWMPNMGFLKTSIRQHNRTFVDAKYI
jgi:hypothetical protein